MPHVLNALVQIRHVSEPVFCGLGGAVGDFRKCAEGRDVDEMLLSVVKAAHVQRLGLFLDNMLRRLERNGGDAQRSGEVIGAARRQVTEGDGLAVHDAGGHLVERAVAAGADHQVETFIPGCHGQFPAVTLILGDRDRHEIACAAEAFYNVIHRRSRMLFPRHGIDDKQQFFHRIPFL